VKKAGMLSALEQAGHHAGQHATHVVRLAVYGTRRTPDTNAGDAPGRSSAIGKGLHTVWQGPKKVRSGAPVLTRNRPA
jgi:hypothetical protein